MRCACFSSSSCPRLRFLGVCFEPPAIVMELCGKDSLYDLLAKARNDPETARQLTWQRRIGMVRAGGAGHLLAAACGGGVPQWSALGKQTPLLLQEGCSRRSQSQPSPRSAETISSPGRHPRPARLPALPLQLLDCARGMLHLHSHVPIVLHRDLKSPNLWVRPPLFWLELPACDPPSPLVTFRLLMQPPSSKFASCPSRPLVSRRLSSAAPAPFSCCRLVDDKWTVQVGARPLFKMWGLPAQAGAHHALPQASGEARLEAQNTVELGTFTNAHIV